MGIAVGINGKVAVGYPLPSCPASGVEWKAFQFCIHDFAILSITKYLYIASPEFTYYGQWELLIYSGGQGNAAERCCE